jgi:hypothetical protein
VALGRINQRNTVRLVATAWSEETVLGTLGLPDEVLSELAELDGATNERMGAEEGFSVGMPLQELVFGVPEATIINAAFTHAGEGGRFHGPDRGAWYAGFDEATALDEVQFHRRRSLRDTRAVGAFALPHRAFLADFAGAFHHLTPADKDCLAAEPVPNCYVFPRMLSMHLLNRGSAGIVYPSVRHADGWGIACFRPALVFDVRRGEMVTVNVTL